MKELYHAKIAVQIFSNSLRSFGFQKNKTTANAVVSRRLKILNRASRTLKTPSAGIEPTF